MSPSADICFALVVFLSGLVIVMEEGVGEGEREAAELWREPCP